MTTSFGALLREGFTATLRDRRGLLLFGLPAALLLALAWTVSDRLVENSTALSVVVELVLAYIAYFWQRRYLLGPQALVSTGEARREEQREINRLASRYVGRAAVYYIALTVLALLISFPFFLPFLDENDSDSVVAFLGILSVVLTLLMLISAQFLLAFPACAAGVRMGWAEAWRLGRGHGLRLGAVVIVFMLPLALLAVGFAVLVPSASQESLLVLALFNTGVGILRIGGMFMGLVSVAYLYRKLVAKVDAQVFD